MAKMKKNMKKLGLIGSACVMATCVVGAVAFASPVEAVAAENYTLTFKDTSNREDWAESSKMPKDYLLDGTQTIGYQSTDVYAGSEALVITETAGTTSGQAIINTHSRSPITSWDANTKYTVSFMLKGAPIHLYFDHGGAVMLDDWIRPSATEWTYYEYTFTPSEAKAGAAVVRYSFLVKVAEANTQTYIDDFFIEEYIEPTTSTVTTGSAIGTLPTLAAGKAWKVDNEIITADTVWNYTENKTATVVDAYTLTFEDASNREDWAESSKMGEGYLSPVTQTIAYQSDVVYAGKEALVITETAGTTSGQGVFNTHTRGPITSWDANTKYTVSFMMKGAPFHFYFDHAGMVLLDDWVRPSDDWTYYEYTFTPSEAKAGASVGRYSFCFKVAEAYKQTYIDDFFIEEYEEPTTSTVAKGCAIGELPALEEGKAWAIGGEIITADTVWNYTENKTATVVESYTLTFKDTSDREDWAESSKLSKDYLLDGTQTIEYQSTDVYAGSEAIVITETAGTTSGQAIINTHSRSPITSWDANTKYTVSFMLKGAPIHLYFDHGGAVMLDDWIRPSATEWTYYEYTFTPSEAKAGAAVVRYSFLVKVAENYGKTYIDDFFIEEYIEPTTSTVTTGGAIGELPALEEGKAWAVDGKVITADTVWNYTENKTATVVESYTLTFVMPDVREDWAESSKLGTDYLLNVTQTIAYQSDVVYAGEEAFVVTETAGTTSGFAVINTHSKGPITSWDANKKYTVSFRIKGSPIHLQFDHDNGGKMLDDWVRPGDDWTYYEHTFTPSEIVATPSRYSFCIKVAENNGITYIDDFFVEEYKESTTITVAKGCEIGTLPEIDDGYAWAIGGEIITADTIWNYAEDKTANVSPTYTLSFQMGDMLDNFGAGDYGVVYNATAELTDGVVTFHTGITNSAEPSSPWIRLSATTIPAGDYVVKFKMLNTKYVNLKYEVGAAYGSNRIDLQNNVSNKEEWTEYEYPITLTAEASSVYLLIQAHAGEGQIDIDDLYFGEKIENLEDKQFIMGSKMGELPAIPEKTNYTGVWMIDGMPITAETEWSYDTDKIATLVYMAPKYTVTIQDYDGTVLNTQVVTKDHYATAVANPSRPTTPTAEYTFVGWKDSEGNVFDFASTKITKDITVIAQYSTQAIQIETTEIQDVKFLFTSSSDNWLVFTISNHDYTCDTSNAAYTVSKGELHRIGFLENVIVKGSLQLGSTPVEEATLAQIFDSNGEGALINYWDTGTFGVRIRGTSAYNSIESITVNAGTHFPSYQYAVAGNTETDVRYMTTSEKIFKPGTAVQSSNKSWTTPFASISTSGYDISMAEGAAVRIVKLNDYDGTGNYMETEGYKQSGIRFQTLISKASIAQMQSLLGNTYDSVSFGTLIVPSADLVGGQFTHAWLEANGVTYMDIVSSAWITAESYAFADEVDDYVTFYGSIVNMKVANHSRYFSGVGYIKIEKGEETIYYYAPYNAAYSRSITYIAQAAVADRSATQTDQYDNKINENNNWSPYTEGEITFLKLYMGALSDTEAASETFTLKSTGALASVANSRNIGTLTVNKKLNGAYVQLNYQTDIDVWGKFYYQNSAGTKKAEEDFYLPKGSSQHKQFLDLFRKNGVGKLAGLTQDDLYLTKIEFRNATVDTSSTGTLKFLGLYSTAKNVGTLLTDGSYGLEVYITKTLDKGGEMTLGAHLGLGGALTYLAKSGIYEGVTSGTYNKGSVLMRTSTESFVSQRNTDWWGTSKEAGYYGHATSSKPGDGAVNLINNYDAGRQVQQSWYANVGGSLNGNTGANGYTRLDCETGDGGYWPYNPVQAGDCNSNPSQIVDYEVNETKGYIYVKTRAMDWAYGVNTNGSTTKSYMENYYRLNTDGTVYVNNSFVEWNGFTDMDTCNFCLVELPAFIPVHTLNHFFTYDGTAPWTGGDLTMKNDLSIWTSEGNPHYQSRIDKNADGTLGEEWVAWANDYLGSVALGIYIPNVTRFVSGRYETAVTTATSANVNANSNLLKSKGLMSNMQSILRTYQSCYVTNTSYTAPGIEFRMEAYVPIDYTYVLSVNKIDTVREQFKEIHDTGKVTNAGNNQGDRVGLDAWARGDKIWTQI